MLRAFVVISVVCAAGCAPTQSQEPVSGQPGVMVQRVRASASAAGDSTFLGMDFLATDARGRAIPCADAELEVQVSIAFGEGPFFPVEAEQTQIRCGMKVPHDIALVLDNSGSQSTVVDKTAAGARAFARDVLRVGGRVSVVRVSTDSRILVPLSDDIGAIETAIDGMSATRGWTALYDGVRMGNETLGAALNGQTQAMEDVGSFCGEQRAFGVVVFTNGDDNNSAGERLISANNDGLATTVEDLMSLNVDSVTTPVHLIGLGRTLDKGLMAELAGATGGRFLDISDADVLPYAFDLLADYRGATTQVCAEVPAGGCGDATIRVSYHYTGGRAPRSATVEYHKHVPCPVAPPEGRSATIVMKLTDRRVDPDVAAQLVANAVEYVAPGPQPRVLFVRDDNHRGEAANDTPQLRVMLDRTGVASDTHFMPEPKHGLLPEDIEGYDVIWFSNPGLPMDDEVTRFTLEAALAAGKGVITSGDDVSASMGQGFPMTPLTHLIFEDNGTNTCGEVTDADRGANYRVTVTDDAHPLTRGLAGQSFLYGDDIDHTIPAGEGEEVLAWATLDGSDDCPVRTPVIVAFDPARAR